MSVCLCVLCVCVGALVGFVAFVCPYEIGMPTTRRRHPHRTTTPPPCVQRRWRRKQKVQVVCCCSLTRSAVCYRVVRNIRTMEKSVCVSVCVFVFICSAQIGETTTPRPPHSDQCVHVCFAQVHYECPMHVLGQLFAVAQQTIVIFTHYCYICSIQLRPSPLGFNESAPFVRHSIFCSFHLTSADCTADHILKRHIILSSSCVVNL